MSNLRRDDNTYGMSWVRVAGPLAVCLYQACEDYCHRMLSGATVPRSEVEIILPWPLRPGELDAAIELLVRLGRFEIVETGIFLPIYFLEQESDEDQKSSRAKQVLAGKGRAATAKRDAHGRLLPSQQNTSQWLDSTSHKLDSGKSPPASGPGLALPGLAAPLNTAASPPPSASPPVPTSEAEKPKKPRKPRSESKYHPNYTAALEAINEEFVMATGSKPDWTAAKEREAVNRLCGQWSVDEIRKRARRFWKDHLPAWVWRDKITTPSVSAFSTHFGELHVNEAANDGLSWFQRNPGWENERTGTNGTH